MRRSRERKMLKVIEIELANIKSLAFIDGTLQLIMALDCVNGIFVISCNFVSMRIADELHVINSNLWLKWRPGIQ